MESSKIIKISDTKKSLVLDRGYAEGLRNGDRAKIYFQDRRKGLLNPKLYYVAEGEVVKVQNNFSYWFLRKIKNFRYLSQNNSLVIIRQDRDPRRPFIAKRQLKIQGRGEEQEYFQVSEDKGVPEDLIFEEENYNSINDIRETTPTKRQDLEVQLKKNYINSSTEWDETFSQVRKNQLVPGTEYDRELLSLVKKSTRKKVWDSTSRPSVEKYNDMQFGLKEFYAQTLRDNATQVKEKTDYQNAAEKEYFETMEKRHISPEIKARIRKEGLRWSKGMTDEQLRKYFIATGVEEELRRQKKALEERAGSEFTIKYTTNLTTTTTELDPDFNGTGYGLSLSYEWHLANTANLLKSFTLEGEVERAISYYDIGGFNGRIAEGSLKGYVNWYFWNPPTSLEKYMPYFGFGFKRGNGDMQTTAFATRYQYQLVGFPSSHIGLKYRFSSGDGDNRLFKMGFGVNIQLRYEKMRYNVAEILDDDAAGVLESAQTRLSIGFNVYF